MICPVEIARDMSALRAVRVGDHGKHGVLVEGRDGAGDESTGSHFAGDSEEDHMVASSRGRRDQRPFDGSMRRWRERYEEFGYDGLFDRRCGKPSPRRVPVATVEKVFTLYREKYFDLNVRHFYEKLKPDRGIELSYTGVKQALQGAGLVGRERKREVHRKRRERRPCLSTKCPIATSSSIAC